VSTQSPPGAYTTILADPSWRFNDRLRQSKTKRSAEDQYELTMSVEEIAALYTPSSMTGPMFGSVYTPPKLAGQPIADVGFLNLWAPAAFILDGSATHVARTWGFEPKQIIPWIKGEVRAVPPRDGCHDLPDAALYLQMGMGRIFRNCVEFMVICTRGRYTELLRHKGTHGLIVAPEDAVMLGKREKSPTRGVEHSTKPKQQYDLIEKVMPGPYLELFACEKREGWTSIGTALGTLMTPQGVVPYCPGADASGILPDPGLSWEL
jgi:N6-adenosine-specific RNA methylase IME4